MEKSDQSRSQPTSLPYMNTSLSLDDYIKQKVAENLKIQREAEAKRDSEFQAQQLEERKRFESVILKASETIKKNKETIQSATNSISKLQASMTGLKEVEQKFIDFQSEFSRIWGKNLEKAFGIGEDVLEMKSKYGEPKISTVEETKGLLGGKKIAFLTGAGLSAESGVFVYKNNEETVFIAGKEMRLQEAMNIDVYEDQPLEFWRYIQRNRERIGKCLPNAAHLAISALMARHQCKVVLVTQNIDGFDKIALKNNPNFFEVHGNIHEMRCKTPCCQIITPSPPIDEELLEVPKCVKCGDLMRPNVLLYGESYSEEFYRSDSAKGACEDADVLMVIGTQLNLGFPNGIVTTFAKTGNPIIEINIDPVVQYGNVFVLTDPCSTILPSVLHL